ncbi:hypothetical protein GJAV_G00190480 [Gymnothorax javanicus]|nr:hypothetical protein GJAV_G00190480 [Gymnothorax javanicus]
MRGRTLSRGQVWVPLNPTAVTSRHRNGPVGFIYFQSIRFVILKGDTYSSGFREARNVSLIRLSSRRMTSSSKRKEEVHLANGAVKQSTWSKVFNSNAVWEEKDEFLDVIYWFRQIIAVVLGVIWGIVPLKGFLGIAIFCIINAGLLYVYFSSYQQVDEEEYGGTWELTKEGFMTSFALFLVVWIIFYTALHYD